MSSVLSLSIMIHYVAVCLYVFHTMFTNVTLAFDFICMLLLVFPFKHVLLCIYYITFTCVYYLCIYYITTVMYLLHYFYLCVLFMYLLHHFTCVLYITMYLSIYILTVGD